MSKQPTAASLLLALTHINTRPLGDEQSVCVLMGVCAFVSGSVCLGMHPSVFVSVRASTWVCVHTFACVCACLCVSTCVCVCDLTGDQP